MESEESALDDPLGKSGPNSLFFFFVIFSSIPMPLYVFIFEQPPPGVFKQNPTPWPPSPSHGTQGLEKPKRCSLLEQKSHNFASSFLNAGIWELAILAPTDPIPSVFPLRIMVPFCVESALSGVVFAATDMFVSSITEAHLYIDRGPKHNQHLGNPLFSTRQYYIPATRVNQAISPLHHQHHLVQVMAPLPPNHRLVYRRTFRLPPWVKNQRRTLLHFQAVDHQTEVPSLCSPCSRCLLTEFKLEATLVDTMRSASISPTCWRRRRRQNKNFWLSLRIQPSLRFFDFFWIFGESQFQAIPVGKQWSSGERPFQFIFYTPTSGIWQVGQLYFKKQKKFNCQRKSDGTTTKQLFRPFGWKGFQRSTSPRYLSNCTLRGESFWSMLCSRSSSERLWRWSWNRKDQRMSLSPSLKGWKGQKYLKWIYIRVINWQQFFCQGWERDRKSRRSYLNEVGWSSSLDSSAPLPLQDGGWNPGHPRMQTFL